MTFLQAIILGIVEGLTEFLPISSTAHLEFASRVMGIASTDFLKSFEISIQLGAILAVALIYAGIIWKYKTQWKKIAVAFLPTAVIGFTLYPLVKSFFLGNASLAAYMLVVGGILMIFFEKILSKKTPGNEGLETVSYKQALLVGLAQSLAVVPGVSRSGATVYGGLFAGLSRATIVDFSFLLAIPTMAAATGYDLLKNSANFSSSDYSLLAAGFVAAFLSALIAIRFFLAYARRNDFTIFGIYRILAGILFLLAFS